MLKSLNISNYAIIDELELQFPQGLTTITGETGAGKSIMTGALNLILGERADSSVLYDENKNCVIEGVFDVRDVEFPANLEIDTNEEIYVRRIIYSNGKSRAFFNDEPIKLSRLKEIMNLLIQQHRQFDTLDINSPSFQIKILDALANNEAILNEYQVLFNELSGLRETLTSLKNKELNATKEKQFLEFQAQELDQASLVSGEQSQLEQELNTLENAEEIKSVFAETTNLFEYKQQNVIEELRSLITQYESISQSYPRSNEFAERIQTILIEAQELSREASIIADEIEHNPDLISEKRGRLDYLYKLLKKHNYNDTDDLIAYGEEIRSKLENIGTLSDEIQELEKNIDIKNKQLLSIGEILHKNRAKEVNGFIDQVKQILATIAIPHARIEIELEKTTIPKLNGITNIDFKFSANVGGKMSNISDVASGGELSRLALAIKSVVASAMTLPTMLFDEIDQGVSGDISLKMGKLLSQLAQKHQIIVITHSAQIASQGNKHYYVYKTTDNKRTYTKVKDLEGEDRINHIAIMLSQDPPSQAAIKNAEELITQLN